jgi:hypothetical protein
MVPVAFKPLQLYSSDCIPCQNSSLFSIDTWIQPPIAPANLLWTNRCKMTSTFILHYMSATSSSSTSAMDRIEYIGDILLLKVENNHVINAQWDDLDLILHFVRDEI